MPTEKSLDTCILAFTETPRNPTGVCAHQLSAQDPGYSFTSESLLFHSPAQLKDMQVGQLSALGRENQELSKPHSDLEESLRQW